MIRGPAYERDNLQSKKTDVSNWVINISTFVYFGFRSGTSMYLAFQGARYVLANERGWMLHDLKIHLESLLDSSFASVLLARVGGFDKSSLVF